MAQNKAQSPVARAAKFADDHQASDDSPSVTECGNNKEMLGGSTFSHMVSDDRGTELVQHFAEHVDINGEALFEEVLQKVLELKNRDFKVLNNCVSLADRVCVISLGIG